MRAVVVEELGKAVTVGDVAASRAQPGEVVVGVNVATVNGFDLAVAAGYMAQMMEHRFPVVLGVDFAGVVEAVGEGVDGFAVGDRVAGVAVKPVLGEGTIAEQVVVPAGGAVGSIPEGVDDVDAAAVMHAGGSALAALNAVEAGAGDTLLITGGTGGVGHVAVQLAAQRGATVLATARPGKGSDLLRELGATHVIDRLGDLTEQVRALLPDGVDAAIHLAGDEAEVAGLVHAGGHFATLLSYDGTTKAPEGVTGRAVGAATSRADVDQLLAGLADGSLRPVVQGTYDLDEAPQAFADFAAPKIGKLVIRTR